MGKRLDITPKIAAAIERSTGGSVDPNSVAVFETIALNTLPLGKKGSLFEKATATESLLTEMSAFLNTGDNFVPLHLNHDQDQGMPVGRVFAGEVHRTEAGGTELRSLFYLPLSSHADLIEKIETGVIAEVSVGVQPKHITCSECGFDYLSAEATVEHLWDRTCENGHTVGHNGVHTNFSGLERFFELSLVSLGAASKARIQSRVKSLLSSEDYAKKLAATGIAPEATALFTSPTKEEPAMDLTALVADLTTAKANLQVTQAAHEADKATVASLTSANQELSKEVASLKASLDESKLPAVQAELDTLKASLSTATETMRAEADRLAVAASLDKPVENASIDTLVASITTSRAKLATMIPVGGVAQPATTESGTKGGVSPTASFKTRK